MLQTDLFLNQAKAPRQSWRERSQAKLVISEGSTLVTPEMAGRILKECRFEGQRTVFEHQVTLLVSVMERGDWLPDDQVSFCKLPDGTLYLVNGYHRMNAVIKHGKPIKFSFRIIDTDTMDQVRRTYVLFDTQIRKRSEAEIIDAMNVLDAHKITAQTAVHIYRAAPLLANKMLFYNYQTMPEIVSNVTQRILVADRYWSIGKQYQDLISGATAKHKKRMLIPSVLAVGVFTIKYQPQKAAEFWEKVATMEGLRNNDPRMALAKTLDEKDYKGIFKNGEIPTPAIDCSLAWNAFYENRTLKYLRTATVKNFKLAGTPWR